MHELNSGIVPSLPAEDVEREITLMRAAQAALGDYLSALCPGDDLRLGSCEVDVLLTTQKHRKNSSDPKVTQK